MQNIKLTNQSGSAIIVALFLTALVAAAATAMMSRLAIDIKRTELQLNTYQAQFYAEGSLAWAMDQLRNNWLQKKPGQLVDKLPISSNPTTVNGFKITSTIEDAQSNFNINNLSAPEYQMDLIRLLRNVETKLSPTQAVHIAQATRAWITPSGSKDDYDAYYEKQQPAYRSAHKPMASISELRLVKGMTTTLFNKLLPFITALPEQTKLNINTATAPALLSLTNGFSPQIAQVVTQYRQHTPFLNPTDFLNVDSVKHNINPSDKVNDKITETSNYFLVKTHVAVGQQETVLYTLVARDVKGSNTNIQIVWQTKGTL